MEDICNGAPAMYLCVCVSNLMIDETFPPSHGIADRTQDSCWSEKLYNTIQSKKLHHLFRPWEYALKGKLFFDFMLILRSDLSASVLKYEHYARLLCDGAGSHGCRVVQPVAASVVLQSWQALGFPSTYILTTTPACIKHLRTCCRRNRHESGDSCP